MLARLNSLAGGLNRVQAGSGGWTIPLPPPEKIRFGLRYIHIYIKGQVNSDGGYSPAALESKPIFAV